MGRLDKVISFNSKVDGCMRGTARESSWILAKQMVLQYRVAVTHVCECITLHKNLGW